MGRQFHTCALMGLSTWLFSKTVWAADLVVSYQLTGPQAADYTVADSGWNNLSTVF
jgi:hypothetical protein